MPTSFFSAAGKFHRGNLHTHSTNSDGVLAPEEVCRRYQAEGYDFISLTDHFVGLFDYPITDTTAFHNQGFTTILGAELHTGTMENGHLWHLVAAGLPHDFTPPNAPHFRPVKGSESAASIAQRARDAGAFVAIAHPHWSGMGVLPFRFGRQPGVVAAHVGQPLVEGNGIVPGDPSNRTRIAPSEKGRIIAHHRLPLGLRNLVAADVEIPADRHAVDRLLVAVPVV